jgi:hypothetical protein
LNNISTQLEVKRQELQLICGNGNALFKCKHNTRRSYFRHKGQSNANYNEMSEWHKKWQSYFSQIEVKIGNRVADVVVNDNVLEFQHSNISKELVDARKDNYKLHKKNLIWIIDCCNDKQNLTQLDENRYLICFNGELWKYASFMDNAYICLDFNDQIVRIKPSNIKSKMIYVSQVISKEEFIDAVKNDKNIWIDTIDQQLSQCTLYHNQRGAGCGKTYESIQLLQQDDRFSHKDTFIYLTKMHSAKEVIYNELKDQEMRGDLSGLAFEKSSSGEIGLSGSQYKINYHNNKTKTDCTMLIGTIDSFMYAIGNKNVRGHDYFKEIVLSIRSGYVNTCSNNGIKYASKMIHVSARCLIIIDEAQDLGPEYIEAMAKIMGKTLTDTYVIGDKLQSIWGINNIHTFLETEELPSIKIIKNTGINHVMRFHNNKFIDFVNKLIPFKQYNLDPITKICDSKSCKYVHENKITPHIALKTIIADTSKNGIKSIESAIKEITDIMSREVEQYNYLPKNFMFIFPILSNNYFASSLELKIQEFWISKFKDDKYVSSVLDKDSYWRTEHKKYVYHKCVFLHKSDDGKPINLKESEDATRILSIHSSKGSGCEVVFLLGAKSSALKRFSNKERNLVFDSLLHVAITRQKKMLYYQPTDLFKKCTDKFIFDLNSFKKTLQYTNLVEVCKVDANIFTFIDNNYIKKYDYNKLLPKQINNNAIIDWGHHTIRNCVFKYYILYHIVNNENTHNYIKTDHTSITLKNISEASVELCDWGDYIKYLQILKKSRSKCTNIKIYRYNDDVKSIYYKYATIIIEFIKSIQSKITSSLANNKFPLLCPMETVILMFLIEIIMNNVYADIAISEIYQIIYYYDECSNELDSAHDIFKCICRKHFKSGNDNEGSLKYQDIRNSIKKHYEKTKEVGVIYNNYKNYLDKHFCGEIFRYNINTLVWFGGHNNNFNIFQKYEIIAYSDNYVIAFTIKPQVNMLNFSDITFNSIFNEHNIISQKKMTYDGSDRVENEKYKKYSGKKIITCILTLSSINPIFINFDIKPNDNILESYIKNAIINNFATIHSDIYLYYQEFNDINDFLRDEVIEKFGSPSSPKYVEKMFNKVKEKIRKAKKKKDGEFLKNKKTILKNFENETAFINKCNKELEIYTDSYLFGEKEYIEDV